MAMEMPEETKRLLFYPERFEKTKQLWIVRDILDRDELAKHGITNVIGFTSNAINAGYPMEGMGNLLTSFPTVFVAFVNVDERQTIVDFVECNAPTVQILQPADGVFGKSESLLEFAYNGGEPALKRLMLSAVEVAPGGLLNLADVERVDISKIPRVLSGIKELDSSVGGFRTGELSIWTGKRGSGKSTLLGQILLQSIDQCKNVCVYSGELSASQFKDWTMTQAAGSNHIHESRDDATGHVNWIVDSECMDKIDAWWNNRFFLYDNKVSSGGETDSILKVFKYASSRFGCSVFLVDNLMTTRFTGPKADDYFRAQSEFTGRLVDFAKTTGAHVHLVAHPRKQNGSYRVSDADDVGGSGDVTNRADNVFSLSRLPESDAREKGYGTVLSVLKNRTYGVLKDIPLIYKESCRRFVSADSGKEVSYGWESGGYEDERAKEEYIMF